VLPRAYIANSTEILEYLFFGIKLYHIDLSSHPTIKPRLLHLAVTRVRVVPLLVISLGWKVKATNRLRTWYPRSSSELDYDKVTESATFDRPSIRPLRLERAQPSKTITIISSAYNTTAYALYDSFILDLVSVSLDAKRLHCRGMEQVF
jgi:hypothetical protein